MFLRRKMLVLSTLLVCSLFLSSCTNCSLTLSAEHDFRHCFYKRAFEKLWWSATLGHARAQYMLGYLYYYGLGTVRDQDIGRIWIRRSADKNFIPAVLAYRAITNPRYPQYVPFQTNAGGYYYSNKRSDPIERIRKLP